MKRLDSDLVLQMKAQNDAQTPNHASFWAGLFFTREIEGDLAPGAGITGDLRFAISPHPKPPKAPKTPNPKDETLSPKPVQALNIYTPYPQTLNPTPWAFSPMPSIYKP